LRRAVLTSIDAASVGARRTAARIKEQLSMSTATIDATSESGARAERRLRDDTIAWLTTVRPSGQPDTVPVWFLWDGATVLIYSRPEQNKERNIAGNPRVSVVLDNTQGGGEVVRIEGRAEVVAGAPLASDVPDYVAKYAAHIQRIGFAADSFAGAYTTAIRVTPTRIHY
jgi:PPOX class probable F420-dependent enzyme